MTHQQASLARSSWPWHDAWLRLRDTAVVASWVGTSWRKLHSPTLFEWGRALQSNPRHWPHAVVQGADPTSERAIALWRRELSQSREILTRRDLGAGQRTSGQKKTSMVVKELATQSLTPASDAQAMCRWLRCVAPQGRFLELGTSLGVMAAHVAATGWEVKTWEGCPDTLGWAQKGWESLGLANRIQAQCGDFMELVRDLGEEERWDVVYLDGFHEEHATLYLADALSSHISQVLVIDDISWSSGMHRAWRTLQERPEWRVSFSWRGRGFLLKAPHMERQRFQLS